ncbi:MAG: sugar phosphate isomerase/epimerase family protein, partial [Puniceicoccaceae bacterium]
TNIHNWSRQFKQEGRPFDVDQFLREVKELGMTGIEARFNNVFTIAPSNLKTKLREYGLQATAVGASVTAEPYAPNVEDYQAQIRAAAELEAPLLMVCGGFLANNRRNTYPADYDRFADSLGAAIEFAAGHGVTLAFHPHRGCIVETIAETRMMVDRLPELKLCIDTAHLASSGEDAAKFAETFADRIVHTHIKDYDSSTLQFCEPGTGDSPLCDIRAVLEILRGAGYEGPLCLELDGGGELQRPAKESARMSLEFMRG